MVAGRLFRVLLQMVIHLGIQRPLGQCLLQLIEQPILLKQRFRVSPFEQLVITSTLMLPISTRYPRINAVTHRGDQPQ